jgi:hypothetical protein
MQNKSYHYHSTVILHLAKKITLSVISVVVLVYSSLNLNGNYDTMNQRGYISLFFEILYTSRISTS